jgi:alkyl sulfatase BDS1-like metallo-beta-lactamase superfamily hydrolase
MLTLPAELEQNWPTRGYYGTLRHNSRAVYQRYMGWYDGNPANLHPLPQSETAEKYVEMMGGVDKVVATAQLSFDKGEYQWVAELLNHAVFAQPDHLEAKALLATTYDQMAYQAESGPWRSEYLTAAHELRHGITMKPMAISDAVGLLKLTPTAEFLKSFAVRIDPDKAEGKDLTIELSLKDVNETFVLVLRNSVLNYYQKDKLKHSNVEADVSLSMNKDVFLSVLTQSADLKDLLLGDALTVEGSKLDLLSFFASMDSPNMSFPIVTP